MEKTSFVFHFDYLADVPEELRGQWAVFIIDYAEKGIEPDFSSWLEVKLWNGIKNRIDSEAEKYEKKSINLRQNKTKNLQSIENQFSVTESENENSFGDRKSNIGDREHNTNSSSVGEFVNDYVYVYEFVIGYVNEQNNNQPTSSEYKLKLDKKTADKIGKSLEAVGIEMNPYSLSYAYQVISSKPYGKNKESYSDKTPQEQKAIFCHALLNYPEDIFTGFQEWKKKAEKEAEKKRLKELEAKARASPPRICKCGADLINKGSGMMCFNCRRTYEIIKGEWCVNE